MLSAVHVATYMIDIDQPVFPFRHRPSIFYDIITITKIWQGRWHSLLRRRSVSNLQRPLFVQHYKSPSQQATPPQSLLGFSGAHQVVNFSMTAACAQMRLLILRGHSWLPFYVMTLNNWILAVILWSSGEYEWLYSSDALCGCEKKTRENSSWFRQKKKKNVFIWMSVVLATA